jgi:hypothetical protein
MLWVDPFHVQALPAPAKAVKEKIEKERAAKIVAFPRRAAS